MIGIDTIRLKLSRFEIDQMAPVLVNTDYTLKGEDKSEELIRLTNGTRLFGKKAYLNRENYNFEILRGIGGVNAFVHFSIPKIVSGSDNSRLVDKDCTITAIGKVEQELRENGIMTNLHKAKISRLDICRNIVTEAPYREYDNVLNNLQMKRAAKKDLGRNVDTHLWKNSLQEICIYDKWKEMEQKKQNLKGIEPRTVRCEIRLMRTRKVMDETDFMDAGDLLYRYDEIYGYYCNKLKKNIFKYSVSEFEVLLKEEVKTRLNYFKTHYKRNWVNEFVKTFGIAMIDRVIGLRVFELALKETSAKRNTIHYVRKNYNKKIFENSLFGGGLNSADLYNELKYKLCEAA